MKSIQVSHVAIKRIKTSTKIHQAAAKNNGKELESLIKLGENIYQSCTESQMTPLAYALNNCHKQAANELLKIYLIDYEVLKANGIDSVVDVVYDKKLIELIENRGSATKNQHYIIPVLLKRSNVVRPTLKWLPEYPSSIDDELLEILYRLKVENSKFNINLQVTPTQNTYLHLIVAFNYERLFDLMVNNFAIVYDTPNAVGQTALHFAMLTGNQKHVEFLIPRTPNIIIERHDGELYKFIYHFNIFELIYREARQHFSNLYEIFIFYLIDGHHRFLLKFIRVFQINLNELRDMDGNNVLHLLLNHHNYWQDNGDPLFNYVFKNCSDLFSERNNAGLLPIHFVIGNCNIKINLLKQILNNFDGEHSRTLSTQQDYDILLAAINSNAPNNMTKFFYLFFGKKIVFTEVFYNCLIFELVRIGDLKLFKKFFLYNLTKLKFTLDFEKLLLKIGKYKREPIFWFIINNNFVDRKLFNFNCRDRESNNLLLHFSAAGSVRIVDFLLDHKCDRHHVNNDNWTIVHKSVLNPNGDVLKFLLNLNINYHQVYTRDTNEIPIMIAVRLHGLSHFFALFNVMETGPNSMDTMMDDKILMASCILPRPVIFLWLIHHPAIDINRQDANGDSVVHLVWAPQYFDFLLNCKRPLNINRKNSIGQTPIMAQILHYSDENVSKLLARLTKFDLLVMHDNANATLLDYFVNVNATYGKRYARVLKRRRYRRIFSNINYDKYGDGNSPMKISLKYDNLAMLKLILRYASRSYLLREINYLIENNYRDYLKFVVRKFNVDLSRIAKIHDTLLKCDIDMMKYLFEQFNLDPNVSNANGKNFLHYSVRRGDAIMVDYLIKIGCNWRQPDSSGMVPFDYADVEMLKTFKFLFHSLT